MQFQRQIFPRIAELSTLIVVCLISSASFIMRRWSPGLHHLQLWSWRHDSDPDNRVLLAQW